jgi:hypothetical protein
VVGKDVVAIVTLIPSGALVSQSELAKELLGDNASQVTIAGQPAWHGPPPTGRLSGRFGDALQAQAWYVRSR